MGDTPDSRGYGNSGDHNFVSDPRRESLFGSLNNPPLKQSQQDNDMGRGNSQERPIVIPDLYESIQQPPQKRRRAAPPNLITGDAPDSETDYPAHPRHTTQSSIGQLREAENDNEHREATQMKTPKVSDTAAVGSNGAALCVEKIIGIFPNISRRFVENLYISRRAGAGELHGMGELEFVQRIVDSILSKPSYPKEEKASKRRRQDGDEDVNGQWVDEGATHGRFYAPEAIKLLCQEFPSVPSTYIRQVLAEKRKFRATYLALEAQERAPEGDNLPYTRLKHPRRPNKNHPTKHATANPFFENSPLADSLRRELNAAKRQARREAAKRQQKEEQAEAERHNEEKHTRDGTLVECQCCYMESPSNRVVPCQGEEAHFFCHLCVRTAAETQIGLMQYNISCFDTNGCGARFSRRHLKRAIGTSSLEKLESLQQHDEITKAGLEGLEECPFCNFKAICPPVEQDREFRCYNPDCEIVSCRLCKDETHIPKTCREAKKEKGISERRLVEEAMSEALIRHCPKCKLQVIKDNGCNKLTCVNCKTSMCYICQRDITGASYKHFSGAPGSCSIGHDPREDDAQRDVNRARAEATQKILAENPNINPEDLRVDVPDYNSSPPRRLHGYPARPQVYLPPARNRRAPRTLGKYNNNRRGNGNGNGNGPVYEMGDFVLDENNAQDPWQLPLHDQDEHRVFMNAWENMYHQQNLQAHPNLLGGYPNTPAQPNPGIPHFSARPDFGFGKPNPRNAYALATPPGPPAPAPAPNFNNARLVPPFGQGFGSNNTTINYPLQPAERDPFAPAPAPPWVNNTGFDGWLQRHSGR